MKYYNIKKGIFKKRENRFIAYIEINGKTEKCHVKNTGRCKELLVDNATVFVEENFSENRKTKFSLISVIKNNLFINMDSQAPNKAVFEWLKKGCLFNDLKVRLNSETHVLTFTRKEMIKKFLLRLKALPLRKTES